MTRQRYDRWSAWLPFVVGCLTSCATPPSPVADCRIGIDHLPTVVADLSQAIQRFRDLGFAIKPGRPHTNGLRNAHIKFPDGSGLELITVEHPHDALAAHYHRTLSTGEGPVYLSFHARDTACLIRVLHRHRIAHQQHGQLVTFANPSLSSIFFVRDNRSPSDRAQHFTHVNSATALEEVWLAPPNPQPLLGLLRDLGARVYETEVAAHHPSQTVHAVVAEVSNGRVVLLAPLHSSKEGRPIIGVVFRAQDRDAVAKSLATSGVAESEQHRPRLILPPETAYGYWLEFRP